MYKFILFLFAFTAFDASAQFVTKVGWSTDSNMPASEVIYYNPGKKLLWSDFRGEVPVETGPVAAITMSGFGFHSSTKFSGSQGDLDIGVYCYFNKEKSWVKPGKTTSYILQHEQLHFDISFIAANLFIRKIQTADFSVKNYNAEVSRIYNECIELMNKMQDDYDNETRNGQDEDRQEKWRKYITEKIAEFSNE